MTKPKTLDTAQVTRRCPECGGTMHSVRQDYDYDESGLSSVRLKNVLVHECKCGVKLPEIPAIMVLHSMIALDLLRKPSRLSGEEIRFLRKMAGLSQAELAEIMGVDPTRPSKWERKSASTQSDKLMRTIFLLGLIQHVAKGKNPSAVKSLAAEKFFREMDVRELLKSITSGKHGPKTVSIENDPSGSGDDVWFLPDLGVEHRRGVQ